jgi:putative endonuclease
MSYYVYIIQSEMDGSYYKGFSEDYQERLIWHNAGRSTYTSRKIPWKLVHVEIHFTKKEALTREKNLKKATQARLEELIKSPKNILLSSSQVSG